MLKTMTEIKQQEYELLNEIAQDSKVTQANLSKRLGIAVGSVNWYIKRLIKRGYVKVSHLDRTRLQYDLTPEGMSVFTERAMQYAKDSLTIYKSFRQKAKIVVAELQARGISQVYLDGNDEIMDILRLTCIEGGISFSSAPGNVALKFVEQEYRIVYSQSN
jgi:DNA-binding MarR family transcriptional regulator